MAGKKGMKRYPIEVRVKAIDMYFEKGYCRKDFRNIICSTDRKSSTGGDCNTCSNRGKGNT